MDPMTGVGPQRALLMSGDAESSLGKSQWRKILPVGINCHESHVTDPVHERGACFSEPSRSLGFRLLEKWRAGGYESLNRLTVLDPFGAFYSTCRVDTVGSRFFDRLGHVLGR